MEQSREREAVCPAPSTLVRVMAWKSAAYLVECYPKVDMNDLSIFVKKDVRRMSVSQTQNVTDDRSCCNASSVSQTGGKPGKRCFVPFRKVVPEHGLNLCSNILIHLDPVDCPEGLRLSDHPACNVPTFHVMRAIAGRKPCQKTFM